MSFEPPLPCHAQVPLASRTTLEVGGCARWLAEDLEPEAAVTLVAAADRAGVPVLPLGGGSNVLIADAGFDGLVVRMAAGAPRFAGDGLVTVGAGCPWGRLVDEAVDRGWAGIECLAGIPGACGAAPIQNIGAYGQEIAEVIDAVEVFDRARCARRWLSAAECGFGYRTSRFKHAEPHRFLVLAVRLRLRPGGPPTLRYADLRARLGPDADLAQVRSTVLEVRARKSMVLDPDDPNRRSAGSFFVNPVVPEAAVAAVERGVRARGLDPARMPRWPTPGGVKLSAAWLIERAGLTRGTARGAVGLSSRHTLALINRGGACAAEVVAFAGEVRRAVRSAFAVTLVPEPVFIGFDGSVDALLG